MRQLTEDETTTIFQKLYIFLGDNIQHLVQRPDQDHVFRFHQNHVYYISISVLALAESVSRDQLISAGTCLGKFTKSGKFRIHITFLDYLAKYAKYKVWVKPGGQQVFLYGNNVLKTHVAKMTQNIPQHAGVVVFSVNDIPLGFGVSARSTEQSLKVQPHDIAVFHQADTGEYIRSIEDPNDY